MRRSAARIAAGVLAALLGSCGGATPSPILLDAPSGPLRPLAPAIVSPARWIWSPGGSAELSRSVFVDASTCLLVGGNGERWLSDRAPDDSCAGHPRAASVLAPEVLVDVRRSASAWLYFGYGGSVYESDEPLGPLRRVGAPPSAIRSTTVTDDAMFVLTTSGKVFRWGPEAGYRQVGPDAYVTQLVSGSEGRLLALAIPEAHYVSFDGGERWAKASFPDGASTVGAQELGITRTGDPAVVSVVGDFALASRTDPIFTPKTKLGLTQRMAVRLVQPTPSATALYNGSAVIDGDHYLEIRRSITGTGGRDIVAGPLTGPLESRRLEAIGRCDDVRVAAAGDHVFVACSVQRKRSAFVAIYLSHDRGLSFTESAVRVSTPLPSEVGIAGSPSGALLVTGACLTHTDDCEPELPLLFEPTPEGDLHAVTISAPDVSAPVLGATFSLDGASAYFVGFQEKQEGASLFSSRDAGRTFSVHALAQPSPYGGDDDAEEHEDTDAEDARRDFLQRSTRQFTTEFTGPATLHIGEDGSLALRVVDEDSDVWFLVNEASRSMRPIAAPVGNSSLAAVGLQALAISLDEPRTAWESLNGGQSWTPITPHQSLIQQTDDFGEPMEFGSITCATSGCVAGDAGLIRQGWGGQAGPPPMRPEPLSDEPTALLPPSGTGHSFSCTEIPGASWEPIRPLGTDPVWGLPEASEVARGGALWSSIFHDPRTGQVAAFSLGTPLSTAVPVAVYPMLGRAPRERTSITHVLEGSIALRTKHGRGNAADSVELGWFNAVDGASGRATLSPAMLALASRGWPVDDPYRRDSLASVQMRVDLAPGGAFFLPHGEPGIFFRRDGSSSPISAEQTTGPFSSFSRRGPALYTVRDGRLVATWLVGDETIAGPPEPMRTALITSSPTAHPSVRAITLASTPDASSPRFMRDLVLPSHLTRVGDASVGVFLRKDDRDGAEAVMISANPDGSFGPIAPAVTPLLLPAQPRPCSAADSTSPRIAMPLRGIRAFEIAGGSAQVVSASTPSRVYGLTAVVLGGQVGSVCVHAWLARSSTGAVLIPGGSDKAIELSVETPFSPIGHAPKPATSARVVKCVFSPSKL